jgi:predicted MFS family arabinose efflux permease
MADSNPSRPTYPRGTLFFTVFLDLAGFGMILPLLPFYAQRYGADALQVGLLFSVYSLAQAVGAPALGRLSDRFGRRPVLLAAIGGHAASLVLFALAESFGLLLAARIAAGLFAANFSIAQAYVADVTAPENRAQGMGLVGAALGMGFVVGPGLGGLLSLVGQKAVPLGAAALALVNLGMVWRLLPESLTTRRRASRWNPIRGALAIGRQTWWLLVLLFLVIAAFSAMEGTIALFCAAVFGFGVVETSVLLVAIGIVIVVVQGGLLGRLVARFGERGLVRSGIVAMAAGLLGMTLASGPTGSLLGIVPVGLVALGAAATLLAVGNGICNPSLIGLISRLTAAEQQGETLGFSRSLGAVARTIGPLWGGWVFRELGVDWPFYTAGALMLGALLLALATLPRLRVPHTAAGSTAPTARQAPSTAPETP